MAELPRYRPLGTRIGSMPSVNFVQTGRAAAEPFLKIDRALSSMADYLYEKEARRAQVAGAQYGAENAPTVEQLSQASESGNSINGEIFGDDTVFGMAARKAAIDVVTVRAETAARNSITQLRMRAKQEDMSADDYQVELNGIIDGYSSVISGVDPVAGVNFEASIAATANSSLLAHAQEQMDRVEAFEKIAVIDDFENNILPMINDAVAAGDTIEGGQLITVDQRLGALSNRALTLAASVDSPELAKDFTKRFNDAVLNAKTNAIVEWAMEDPRQRLADVDDNNIQDVSIKSLWDGLDETQKAGVEMAIIKAEKEMNSLEDSRDRRDDRVRKERINVIKKDVRAFFREGQYEDAEPLIDELFNLDPDEAERLQSVIYTDGGIDKAEVVLDLDRSSLRGRLTERMIEDAIINRDISRSTADRFFDQLEMQRNKRYNTAIKLLSNYYGQPELTNYGKAGATSENLIALSNHMNQIILAIEKDPEFDPIAYAQSIIAGAETPEERASYDAGLSALRTRAMEELGMGADEQDLGAYLQGRSFGASDADQNIILDIMRELAELEAERR